jgi:general secretion pathway protein D
MKTSGFYRVGFHWLQARSFAWGITTLLVRGLAAEAKPQDTSVTAPEFAIARPPEQTTSSATVDFATSAGTNGLHLNFRGAPLRLVLDYLSDAAGFVIDQQAEVRGTIDVWSKEAVDKAEAVQLLNTALRHNGYAAVRNGRILSIVPLENAKTYDLEVVSGNNPETVEKSDELVTQIIPVRYATASQLVNNLQPLLPATASLSVNESANSLILVDAKTDVRRMLKIISALDDSIATVSLIKVFTLHYADAKLLAPGLQQLFSPQSSSPNGNQRGQSFNFPGPVGFGGDQQVGQNGNTSNSSKAKITITADEQSNSLIVSSPADFLSAISNVVQQVDQPVTDITELRVIKLENADASETADQIGQLFPDSSKSASEQNQSGMRLGPFPGPPGAMMMNNSGSDQSTGDRTRKKSQVMATADRRSNSLLVSAPSTLMPTILQTVARLDANPARKEIVQVYDLHNADPSGMNQILQDLFNRNSAQRTSTANRNSLTGDNNPLDTRETQQQNNGTTSTGGTGTSGPAGQRTSTGTTGF